MDVHNRKGPRQNGPRLPRTDRENRKLRTGRQSGLGRGHTLNRVCVRSSALSSPLGQRTYCRSSASVRSKSTQWGPEPDTVFVTMAAKSSPRRSIALPQWCLACGRLSGPD
jgi:ribosomal protein S14